MKTDLIQKVLESETGVRNEGKGCYTVGDDVELTILIEMGTEGMSIQRVRKVVIKPDLLQIETHKGERVYLSADTSVRAIKFGPSDAGKSRSTGFAALR